MFINIVVPALATWAPVALIIFAIVVAVFAAMSLFWPPPSQRRNQVRRLERWLIARQHRSPKRLWIELIAFAIALAVLVTLFDPWLPSKLQPATFESALTWGTWIA
jgi:dolichol kinase